MQRRPRSESRMIESVRLAAPLMRSGSMPQGYSMSQLTEETKSQMEFEAIVDRAFRSSLKHNDIDEAYLVRVKGWFDYKWEGFAGTLMHEIAIWRGVLRIPPFHPSRILSEKRLRLDTNTFQELEHRRPLHIAQASSENLSRKVADVCASGVFVWYSEVNQESDRASLMVYYCKSGESSGWYAGFFRQEEAWRLGQVKGISRRALETVLS